MTSLFSRLQKLNKEATDALWHVIGSPWNPNGAPWINAGSEDPHGGTYVCDLDPPEGNHSVEDWERCEADAALIVECRNSLPAVLNLIEAAQAYLLDLDRGRGSTVTTHDRVRLREAMAAFVEES